MVGGKANVMDVRREMPQYRSLEVKEKDGLNVELTIDRMIQDIVEGELRKL